MLAIYDNNGKYSDWAVYLVQVRSEKQAHELLDFANREQKFNDFELVSLCEKISWRSKNKKQMLAASFLWNVSVEHFSNGPRDPKSAKYVKKCLELVTCEELVEAINKNYSPENRKSMSWQQKEFEEWLAVIKSLAALKAMEGK